MNERNLAKWLGALERYASLPLTPSNPSQQALQILSCKNSRYRAVKQEPYSVSRLPRQKKLR